MGEPLPEYSPALGCGFAGVERCERAEAHGVGCSVHLGGLGACGMKWEG